MYAYCFGEEKIQPTRYFFNPKRDLNVITFIRPFKYVYLEYQSTYLLTSKTDKHLNNKILGNGNFGKSLRNK